MRSIFRDYFIGSLPRCKGNFKNPDALACAQILSGYEGDGERSHLLSMTLSINVAYCDVLRVHGSGNSAIMDDRIAICTSLKLTVSWKRPTTTPSNSTGRDTAQMLIGRSNIDSSQLTRISLVRCRPVRLTNCLTGCKVTNSFGGRLLRILKSMQSKISQSSTLKTQKSFGIR